MTILPEVGVSKPAIIRNVVVLPHPEGPSKVMKPLSSSSIEILSTPKKLPQRFVTFVKMILGILFC